MKSYDHGECQEILLRALLSGLTMHKDLVRNLERTHRTEFHCGIRAISFDILPWQAYVAVSFCTSSDEWPRVRWQPTDDQWTGYELIGCHNAENELAPAQEFVHSIHLTNPDSRELYHLIWMAAADALLDARIARILRECNIPAADADQLPSGEFEYVVVDEDRVFSGNYCEFVIAQRLAQRLIVGRVQ